MNTKLFGVWMTMREYLIYKMNILIKNFKENPLD